VKRGDDGGNPLIGLAKMIVKDVGGSFVVQQEGGRWGFVQLAANDYVLLPTVQGVKLRINHFPTHFAPAVPNPHSVQNADFPLEHFALRRISTVLTLTLVSSISAAVHRSSRTVAPRPLPSPTGADKFKPRWTLWAA
jgi:hypothetical protein